MPQNNTRANKILVVDDDVRIRDLLRRYLMQEGFEVMLAEDGKSLNDELKLEIQLGNAAPNELLNILTQRGQVTHFLEKIPSVNDIFIKTVSA